MESDGKPTQSGHRKSTQKSSDSSTTAGKLTAKSSAPSACPPKPNGKAVDTSASAAKAYKRKGKAIVSHDPGNELVLFRDVALGPHQADLRFRMVHFWEARNPHTKLLIGEEMLLIDEEGHVIQGFIPAGRVASFLPELVAGSVYKLSNFFGSRSKEFYSVAEHSVTVSFSWNSRLTLLHDCPVQFNEDRFRFHGYEEFQSKSDQKGDLYDFLGHMKLVNGQTMTDHSFLDEVATGEKRQVSLHVQTKDGPVIKLYLWDHAAKEFCQKWKSQEDTPRVVLVTTVNPKQLGGTLALCSMSSTRVFLDYDVEPTREYLTWFGANEDVANKVNAEVVTKPETVTIEELFSYIKQEGAKVAWFECQATVDDVLQGTSWYYISCGACNTKAIQTPTSLTCSNPKCKKDQVLGVPQYLTRIAVYDNSEQAVFVILGDAGRELTGKHAAELVASMIEVNDDVGGGQPVPVPHALLECIGKTYKFVVKVSPHNLNGKAQSFTVTKVFPPDAPLLIDQADEDEAVDKVASLEDVGTGNDRIRKAAGGLNADAAKRAKSD